MSLQLNMLPAGEGDAFHLQWGPENDRRQLIIDMGVRATGRNLRSHIKSLPEAERSFDLLVVTHVDTDHIYGVLSALVDPVAVTGFVFDDVWFNGWTHLNGGSVDSFAPSCTGTDAHLLAEARAHLFGTELESYGGRQGEEFSIWLRQQPWNRAFQGGPVVRPDDQVGPPVSLAHGLTLTVLGPTLDQLAALKPEWRKAVADALKKGTLSGDDVHEDLVPTDLEPMGRRKPRKPRLDSAQQLKKLADTDFESDSTAANGSSIALLAEYEGDKVLFAGDAHPAGLVEALSRLSPNEPLELSAFKLPHHGSKNNVSRELVEAVRCRHWLISTNGIKHYHPDAEAIARVLQYGDRPDAGAEKSILLFNEPSTFNGWWSDENWGRRFCYEAHYGDETRGLKLEINDGRISVI